MDILVKEIKQFRKLGGSMVIAVKDYIGCMDVNKNDDYEVEYKKNQIIISQIIKKKEKK